MNSALRFSLAAPLIDFASASLPLHFLQLRCSLHAGHYLQAVSKQRSCYLRASYWQASHSSKPGSPGRIMHTGPSASGAASTATAGVAAAA
jgi:hypothetical protein